MGCYTTWWRKTGGGAPPPPPSKKISFTGYRKINESSFRTAVADTLSKIKAKYPDAIVNVGGATSTDMVADEEALKAGLDIVMVMPFAYDNDNQRWALTKTGIRKRGLIIWCKTHDTSMSSTIQLKSPPKDIMRGIQL